MAQGLHGFHPVLTVTLSLPEKELSPNARVHWTKLARAKKKYRQEAAWASKVVLPEQFKIDTPERIVVLPVFFWKDKRRRDQDNAIASIKAALDGLQDAGVVENDSGIELRPPIFMWDKEHPRLELRITTKGEPE